MLKENKKMKATQIKEEKQRMINLVDLAYKNDPRIKEMEQKIKIKRENEKKRKIRAENKRSERGRRKIGQDEN